MNIYRALSETILEMAIDKHYLEDLYAELSDNQKEEILLSLDEQLNYFIEDNQEELDRLVITNVINSLMKTATNNSHKNNRCEQCLKDFNGRTTVPKHKDREGGPVVGVRVINNTDLSNDEIEEMVDRFSDLLGI